MYKKLKITTNNSLTGCVVSHKTDASLTGFQGFQLHKSSQHPLIKETISINYVIFYTKFLRINRVIAESTKLLELLVLFNSCGYGEKPTE